MAIKAQTGCALSVMLVCQMAAAQSASPASDEPFQLVADASWANQNRFAEISVGQRQQNYLETDTQALTPNGVLDTETGNQSHIGIALRWQTVNHWLVHLQAQRQSGVTDYNGYLQAGNGTLTPYSARTGNTASQTSLAVGYAINANNWPKLSPAWQITPLLQISQHQWQRNLVQYSESYDYTTQAIGALLQWQPKVGTVLELQALQGQTQSADVDAPALGFATSQPGDTYRQWQLGLSQDLASLIGKSALIGWRLVAHYTNSQYGHAASPTVNGLQAPPSQNRHNAWALGLRKQF